MTRRRLQDRSTVARSPKIEPVASGPSAVSMRCSALLGFALVLSACERHGIDVSAAPERAQATLSGSSDIVGECKALVTVINESVTKVTRSAQKDPPSTELLRLASDMQDTMTRLTRVELTDARLEAFAERYRAMAGEISSSAKGLAKATDGFDPQGMQASELSFETALKLEDPLVTELNSYCQTHR
jgi:hypothetical protein